MASLFCLFVVVIALTSCCVSGSYLAREHVSYYRTILAGMGHRSLDKEGIVALMSLFDGNPKYNLAAVEHAAQSLEFPEPSWDALERLIDKIYGDQISDDPYEPQEIHLAITGLTSSMKAMWVTMKGLEDPFVEYIETGGDWSAAKQSAAISYTYTVPQKWWPIFSGMIYEADMNGLEAGKRYDYRVGGFDTANNTVRTSDTFSFNSKPNNDPNRPTTVASLADHGTFELLGFATVDNMVKLQNDLDIDYVFVAGDLSYAGLSTDFPPLNITKEDEFELIWDLLGIQNQPIAANYPWMVGPGNHERFYNWTAFTHRYKMPKTSEGSVENFWYSFDYGNIHWLSLSSEHDLTDGSPQKNFLLSDLKAATKNRDEVPWIVVSIHKPLYCSDEGTPGGYADLLEETLIEFDVDLTITGHMHCYERVHPVLQGDVTVYPNKQLMPDVITGKVRPVDVYSSSGKGPVHVVQGHAGAFQAERWVQPQPSWSAIRMANGFVGHNNTRGASELFYGNVMVDVSDSSNQSSASIPNWPISVDLEATKRVNYTDTFGFGLIKAINSTHLFYSNQPDTAINCGRDEFWIIKQR